MTCRAAIVEAIVEVGGGVMTVSIVILLLLLTFPFPGKAVICW